MNNIPQISYCIPSKSNLRYLKWSIDSIRKNASRNDHIISVFVDADTDGTVSWCKKYSKTDPNFKWFRNPKWPAELYGIGKAYDYLIENSDTDVVMIWHADMYLCQDADKNAFNCFDPKTRKVLVCSTRIEPPLHIEGPEKIVKDFGMWPEKDVKDGFKEQELIDFVKNNKSSAVLSKGAFAPWMVYKKDYLETFGGHDPIMKSAREDSDIFNRMVLAGWDLRQSWDSYVYHLTCRGGQFQHGKLTTDPSQKSEEWQKLMENSTKEFIRKWGSIPLHDEYMYPIIKPKYNMAFVISNCTYDILSKIEIWGDKIYVDSDHIRTKYISKENSSTSWNLHEKIIYYNIGEEQGIDTHEDIVISFDGNKWDNRYMEYIQLLPDIIKDSGQIGEMFLAIFQINIYKLKTYETTYIKV